MKKLLQILFIISFSLILSSCADRSSLMDSCTKKGLAVFEKSDTNNLAAYVQSCMVENGYRFIVESCDENKDVEFLVALCYVEQV